MTFKLVHAKWADSQTQNGWCEHEDVEHTLALTHTIGLLIAESEAFISVAHSYDPHTEHYNGVITIPRSAVESLRTLCRIKMSEK